MSRDVLTINLLGSPTITSGVLPISSSRGTALLCAYLALVPPEGRARSLVAHHLFADASESVARRRLNTALWRLRRSVREGTGLDIVTTPSATSVGLRRGSDVAVDTDEFEDLVSTVVARPPTELSDADVSQLEKAVELHRGRLLEEYDDDWVLGPRQRFENLYLTALNYLLQHHGPSGNLSAATRYADLALTIEPLREDVQRHLMVAYAAADRPDLVHATFDRYRETLLHELGADPMPETIALFTRLTRGEHAAPTSRDSLVSDLTRARHEIALLAATVDRALGRLGHLA